MTGLERVIYYLYKVIRPVNNVSSSAGMIILAAMMFITAADVFLRYVFDKPILGSYELVQFMLAISVAVGLACCGLAKGHVAIDVLTSRLQRRPRAIVNSIVGFLGLIVASLITWQACIYIGTLYKTNLTSTVLLVPIFPFVAIVAFGFAFLCVVLVVQFLEFIQDGTTK